MGCSQSLNSEIEIEVDLNAPVFKSLHIRHSAAIRTPLRDFCKQVINLHQDNQYKSQDLCYQISCKGQTFSINDCVSIYDLRITPEDVIKITGSVLDGKKIELTLKICLDEPKVIVSRFTKCTKIKDLLECHKAFSFIRGDIQLDPDQTLEDYDIGNKNKIIVLADGKLCEDVKMWKVKKSGLVLEANCMNQNCMAYKQRICVNLGLGEFDLAVELSPENERVCLCCASRLGRVSKIGFCHCFVNILEGNEERTMKIADYQEYPLAEDKGVRLNIEKF